MADLDLEDTHQVVDRHRVDARRVDKRLEAVADEHLVDRRLAVDHDLVEEHDAWPEPASPVKEAVDSSMEKETNLESAIVLVHR